MQSTYLFQPAYLTELLLAKFLAYRFKDPVFLALKTTGNTKQLSSSCLL